MSRVRLNQTFRSTLLVFLFLLGVRAAGADPLVVYDDQLQNGFADWGWADHNLAQNTVVRYGANAISFEPDAYKALFFHRDAGIDSAQYAAIEFWIHGGSTGGQKIRIRAASGGNPISVGSPLSWFVPGGSIPAGSWAKVRVPLDALDVLSGSFDGLWFQDDSGGDQAAVLIDDIELVNPSPRAVYDEQLRNGFTDWSWAVRNLSQTAVVRTGGAAISFEPDGWAALFFHRDAGIDTAEYSAVQFYINGGSLGHQKLRVALLSGGTVIASAPLNQFVGANTVPAGQWAQVRVPFSSLGVTSGSFDGFWIQDDTGGDQRVVYIDDVQLDPAPVKVQISPEAGRTPISPLIYGVNFGATSQAQRLRWPVRRWGGNTTTRYSWVDDISNRGFDWFFQNVEEANANPGALPYGSAADRFIADTRAAGGEALITVPTIGWTPVDRNRRWGFSVAKYGAQQATECTATNGASWCQPDAGSGILPNGTPVAGNDPHDTSREVGAGFVTDWMDHLASQFGSAGQGGVRFFALDNEPMLWNSTHRDIHPAPATYDEIWQKTVTYAAAIKAKDPNAQIFGPVTWGWCDLFGSAADSVSPTDDCMTGDDRTAHGDVPFLEWYLQQVRDYQTAHGVRLVDWVDVHFYPQGPGISLSNDEGASASLRRLRSLRSLYDPSYVDESWIGQPVNLIPRVKQWVGSRLPGAKLAITEYNWGADDGISSALAQAEALATFGRQGVGMASRWQAPAEYSRVEDAFRLYLNYDGAGGKVSGGSVQTVSSKADAVGAYTIFADNSSQDRLYILLFNKDTLDRHVDVALTSGGTYGVSPALFRFDEAQGLRQLNQTLTVSSSGFGIDLPARTATLAVLSLCNGGKVCF